MTYLSMANLSDDDQFRKRVGAVIIEQAKLKHTPDTWSIDSVLAKAVLQSPTHWTANWTPWVATEPGFADTYAEHGSSGITDTMLLSAVQALWTRMGKLWETALNPPTDETPI